MSFPNLKESFIPMFEEDEVGEEDIEKIIDLLDTLSKYGCDDDYTVAEVIDKMLELLKEDEGRFTIECSNNVTIVVEKKDGLFNIYEENSF